jgi:hypothetical protein
MTAEPTPDLHADLPDVLRLVANLATVPRLGREFRSTALALADAGADVERMDGLVIEGEAYDVQWRHEWALCHCGDGKHEFRKDWPRGRGQWRRTRREADAEVTRARQQRVSWETNKPEPHLVTQLVATTGTEVVG